MTSCYPLLVVVGWGFKGRYIFCSVVGAVYPRRQTPCDSRAVDIVPSSRRAASSGPSEISDWVRLPVCQSKRDQDPGCVHIFRGARHRHHVQLTRVYFAGFIPPCLFLPCSSLVGLMSSAIAGRCAISVNLNTALKATRNTACVCRALA